MYSKKISLLLLILFFTIKLSHATTYYWIGIAATNASWANTAAWSSTSGTMTPVGSIPNLSTDIAIFDGGSIGNCSFDVIQNIDKIDIQAGFAFNVIQSVSFSVNSFTISGGIFTGGALANNITINGTGSLTINGGTFISTSGNLSFLGGATPSTFTYTPASPTSFMANGGYINVAAGNTSLTISNPNALLVFNKVNIIDQGTVTFNNNCQINSTFTIDNSATSAARNINIAAGMSITVIGTTTFQDHAGTYGPIYINTGTLSLKGDLDLKNHALGGGTGTVSVVGGGGQTINEFSGGICAIPNFIINKTGGTLSLVGVITFIGPSWKYMTGTVVPGTSIIYFYTPAGASAFTIDAPPSLYYVYMRNEVAGMVHTINNNLSIANNLRLEAQAAFTLGVTNTITTKDLDWNAYQNLVLNTGTISVSGNITTGGSSPNIGGGTGTININGTGAQSFTGVATAGNGTLPSIIVNKASGTLTLANNITVNGDWTYTQGTVNAGTSTVYMNYSTTTASPIIDGQGSATTMAFNNLTLNNPLRPATPFTLGGALDVDGDLTIQTNTSLNTSATSSWPINIGGNFAMTVNVNGILTENNSVITFDGGANQSIYLNDDLYNLTVNKSGGALTLSQPLWVSGSLGLTNGVIKTTTSNILQIQDLATTSPTLGSATSYIDGPLNRQVITAVGGSKTVPLPIGKNGAWKPLDLTASHSVTTPYVYTAEVFNLSANALGRSLPTGVQWVSNNRYWQITRSSGISNLISTKVNFYFDASDQVSNLSKLGVAGTNGVAPGPWVDLTQSPSSASGTGSPFLNGSITSISSPNNPGLYSLANMTGAGINNPLPVVFSSFTGTLLNDSVNLQWSTASEFNNDYFDVERSNDDGEFHAIGQVQSHSEGKSSKIINYNFTDLNPTSTHNYYRIKQVDYDKKYTLSPTIEVTGSEIFKLYPNPFNNTLNIKLHRQPTTDILVSIKSLVGEKVYEASALSTSYDGLLNLDCSTLKTGMYILELNVDGERLVKKVYKE